MIVAVKMQDIESLGRLDKTIINSAQAALAVFKEAGLLNDAEERESMLRGALEKLWEELPMAKLKHSPAEFQLEAFYIIAIICGLSDFLPEGTGLESTKPKEMKFTKPDLETLLVASGLPYQKGSKKASLVKSLGEYAGHLDELIQKA